MRDSAPFAFYEFFCGGGMARAGLSHAWDCLFANDHDAKKGEVYRANWGADALTVSDVAALGTSDLPGRPDLMWASFPCQDLSLAGVGAGLAGRRSGTFWQIDRLIGELKVEGRGPKLVVLENVPGLASSRGGRDFAALIEAIAMRGFRVGALALDAAAFVPQSRLRLFVVAISDDVQVPVALTRRDFDLRTSSIALRRSFELLSAQARAKWVFWRLPSPPSRNTQLIDLLEMAPADAPFRPAQDTAAWMAKLSSASRRALAEARGASARGVGAAYRRTRRDAAGQKVVRVEARFDGLAGCLRTPAGGSSRQALFIVEDGGVRLRALSAREAARLMGLSDAYRLPRGATAAHHLLGDGVVPPVVRFLSENLLEPLAMAPTA
jgi:DNA (cytosine-5)-methyltransferase 1